jgi:nucleotide-binding universal stress UspA family protein
LLQVIWNTDLNQEHAMVPIHKVLHCADFSEPSDYAFALACSVARDQGAGLTVLHIYPPPASHGEVVARRQPDGFREPLLKNLHQSYKADPKLSVEYRLAEGEPAAEILRLAREGGYDLIVMGTHGRAGLGRLLMGSVAEKVIREGPCPVLTTKRPIADPASAEAPGTAAAVS